MLHRSREWSKPFAQAEVPHPSALKLDGSPWHNDSETVVQNCSRNPLGRPNRSWPVVELVSGSRKRKLENGGQRLARQNLEFGPETLKIRRWRPDGCGLTRRNVGGSPAPGNHTAETALAGWGARIRTWEWRNQNPLPYHLATPHQVPESRSLARRRDHSGVEGPKQRPVPLIY